MIIERNSKEVIIRLPASINTDDLQDFIDYTRYKELTSKSKATQKGIDDPADEINKNWWAENRQRFINENKIIVDTFDKIGEITL